MDMAQKVVVNAFGGVEHLCLVNHAIPQPSAHEVVVRLTSIGMNQADLMARRGEYRLISGNPPFTPGIEAGGVIEQIGTGVDERTLGQRIILSLDAPSSQGLGNGTYQSHFVVHASKTIPVPDGIPDELIGALWLPFLTAWGCLIGQQHLQPGQTVLLPAASSSVAIAASQIVKHYGGITIGTTTRPEKVETLEKMMAAQFDHLIVTRDPNWWRSVKKLTQGKGVDIIFDPVAAGAFLNTEIRLLAQGGTLWVYGLLGQPDTVDVTPLIRKLASIRGWLLNAVSGSDQEQSAYAHILTNVSNGTYQLPVAAQFSLAEVQAAHSYMEQGKHIGKLILVP
ncbi:MAG: zinc-binding dehydrogenase [Cyanobacteria bacterium P01_A01_bin.123]